MSARGARLWEGPHGAYLPPAGMAKRVISPRSLAAIRVERSVVDTGCRQLRCSTVRSVGRI